jgi:hypothetical protein
VRLRLAGVDMTFEAADARGGVLLEDYAGEFRIEGTCEIPADLRVTLSTTDAPPAPWRGKQDVTVDIRPDGVIAFGRADFDGSWHPARGAVSVTCWGERTSVGSFLRVICGLFLPRNGGLLVHASSVVSCGRAFLFPGKSGAGKTTLASLAGTRAVLCDEISAVRRVGDDYLAMPTPFFGEMPRRPRAEPAPLAFIGFPVKQATTAIVAVSRARALAEILHCAVAFNETVSGRSEVVDIGCALVEHVPAHEVQFNLHQDPWRMLDANFAIPPPRLQSRLAEMG